MTAFPFTFFFFIAFLIILALFFLKSQREMRASEAKIINNKEYVDLFDAEYDGGFGDLFQFYPHSKIKKIREGAEDESARKSGS
jgi:hypothetical protein